MMADNKLIQICKYAIDSVDDYDTSKGKALRRAFSKGPSEICTSVSVTEITTSSTDNETNASNDQSTDNKANPGSAENNKNGDSTSTGQSSADNNSYKKNGFTIYEAYKRLNNPRYTFEEDDTSHQSTNNDSQTEAGKTNADQSPKPNNSNVKASYDDDDKSVNLTEHTRLEVEVVSKNYGKSVWKLAVCTNSSVKLLAIRAALATKDFAKAVEKSRDKDGVITLIPLSVTTHIFENNITPLIGHCNYAVDSGTDNDKSQDDTICLAVAPINFEKDSTDEKILFKSMFNIVGGDLLKYVNGKKTVKSDDEEDDRRGYGYGRDEKGNNVSQLLKSKFKYPTGNTSTASDFNKIAAFLDKQMNSHNIEYDEKNSTGIAQYAANQDVNKSLICY